MKRTFHRAIVTEIERLYRGDGALCGLDDAGLLELFALRRDEAAFEILIRRHGAMVLGVCRRLLRGPEDVEDAFQATFLVLAEKAGSIRDGGRLGPWLFGVARKVSIQARRRLGRRFEPIGDRELAVVSSQEDRLIAQEAVSALDDELARLPLALRDPLVLCYLEGLTHEEAAERLRWPVGTVRSRMARGRERLRGRLFRRGVGPPAGLAGAEVVADAASAAIPPAPLVSAAVRSGLAFAMRSGRAPSASAVPLSVSILTREVLSAMLMNKIAAFAGMGAVSLGILAAGAGGYAVARQAGAARSLVAGADSGRDPSQERKPARLEMKAEAERLKGQIAELTGRLKELETRIAEGAEPAVEGSKPLKKVGIPAAPAADSGSSMMSMMMAMGSRRAASDDVTYKQDGGLIVVSSRDKRKITAYDLRTGSRADYEAGADSMVETEPLGGICPLSITGEAIGELVVLHTSAGGMTAEKARLAQPLSGSATPVRVESIIAYAMKGKPITQLSVLARGRFYTHVLPEPVEGEITPVIFGAINPNLNGGSAVVAFPAGNTIHAFSPLNAKWDSLDLPVGASPAPDVRQDRVIVTYKSHVYVFTLGGGKWIDIDQNQAVRPSASGKAKSE